MILFLNTPSNSPALIICTVIFFITASITTFDVALINAKKSGDLPPDEPVLPNWTGLIIWFHWGLSITILVLNWKYALVIFLIKFILNMLNILDIIGNFLCAPLRKKNNKILK